MGNENLNVPLAMNSVPIVAFDQRFAFPTPVTLLLKEKIFSFSGDDYFPFLEMIIKLQILMEILIF